MNCEKGLWKLWTYFHFNTIYPQTTIFANTRIHRKNPSKYRNIKKFNKRFFFYSTELESTVAQFIYKCNLNVYDNLDAQIQTLLTKRVNTRLCLWFPSYEHTDYIIHTHTILLTIGISDSDLSRGCHKSRNSCKYLSPLPRPPCLFLVIPEQTQSI